MLDLYIRQFRPACRSSYVADWIMIRDRFYRRIDLPRQSNIIPVLENFGIKAGDGATGERLGKAKVASTARPIHRS
jgi:hypothetical protein